MLIRLAWLLAVPLIAALLVLSVYLEPPWDTWSLWLGAGILLAVPVTIGFVRWHRINRQMRDRNLNVGGFCVHCGYNRRGTDSDVCPECGK